MGARVRREGGRDFRRVTDRAEVGLPAPPLSKEVNGCWGEERGW